MKVDFTDLESTDREGERSIRWRMVAGWLVGLGLAAAALVTILVIR